MKKWMFTAILILIIILLSCQKQKEGEHTVFDKAKGQEESYPIAEIMKSKILSSIDEFKKGNADKGVIFILESLQLFDPKTD